jgi:hypothetical protein
MNYLENFNNTLEELLNIVIKISPDMNNTIKKNYTFPLKTSIYLEKFLKNCENKGYDISTKNEIIFSEHSTIIEYIDFYNLWNDEMIDDINRENIWKYLHTLYIYAIQSKHNKHVDDLYNILKNSESKITEEMQTFLNIIESLRYNIENNKDIDNIDLNDLGDIETEDSGFNMPDLFGGEIGNLAKEIANDIDPSLINLDDPSKLLQNLMSGNLEDDSGIKDLVSNITGKIQSKINSGEVNENDLYTEAENMMKQFNSSNQGSNPLSSLFKGMNMDEGKQSSENIDPNNPLASMFKNMDTSNMNMDTSNMNMDPNNPLASMFKNMDTSDMNMDPDNPLASMFKNMDTSDMNMDPNNPLASMFKNMDTSNMNMVPNLNIKLNNRLELEERRDRLRCKLKEKQKLIGLDNDESNDKSSNKSDDNILVKSSKSNKGKKKRKKRI